MLLFLALLTMISSSYAQTDIDLYIRKFRYGPINLPQKRAALFELGQRLFVDKTLSGKQNISCQSCHSQAGFSGDSLPLGLGEGAEGLGVRRQQRSGLVLGRHTQNIYNVGQPDLRNHFWDGRVARTIRNGWITPEPKFNGLNPELKEVVDTFESVTAMQSIFPFTSPEEMLGKRSKLSRLEAWDLILKKIFEGPTSSHYKRLFKEAYPRVKNYNVAHVGNALSEFMLHHFAAINTPWDQYLRGRKNILTERMKRGAVLFHSKAGCFRCHNRDQFSNFTFHNIGVPQLGPDDKGRYLVSGLESDLYEFRVPALRNVAVTGPYMHSGVFKSLKEVIDHYDDPVGSLRNFRWNPRHPNYRELLVLNTNSAINDYKERTLSPMLSRKLNLEQQEKDDLLCFLAVALTDAKLLPEVMKQGVVNEISDCSVHSF